MRVISRKTLVEYWRKSGRKDSERPLRAWFAEARRAAWKTPADVKADFRNASILQDGRAIFNIHGNRYRLVVWINYDYQIVYIRFVGTHEEYDAIDAQTV